MNPADFVSRYGYPKRRLIEGVSAGQQVAERNPFRYLLYVIVGGASVVLTPGDPDAVAAAGSGASATQPLDIAFARHGSLACEAWFCSATAGVANLWVVEGLASPYTNERMEMEYVRDQTKRETPSDRSSSRVNTSIGTESEPRSSLVIAGNADNLRDFLRRSSSFRRRIRSYWRSQSGYTAED